MITEDYVSFETAKLLKGKGFESDVNAYYHIWDNGHNVCSVREFSRSEAPHLYTPAPTQAIAMKWLREVHNKHCDVGYDIDLEWYMQIIDLKETIEDDYTEMKSYHSNNQCNFKSYEEACEAAIRYCLEKLI